MIIIIVIIVVIILPTSFCCCFCLINSTKYDFILPNIILFVPFLKSAFILGHTAVRSFFNESNTIL